jgi:hypothetical protein
MPPPNYLPGRKVQSRRGSVRNRSATMVSHNGMMATTWGRTLSKRARELWLSSDTRACTAQSGSGSRYHGTPANQGRCCRSGQQDRTYGLGHDGTRRTLQGAKINLGSGIAKSRSRASTNWRGHDDVMQIRSFRGSGEPAWVIAYSKACSRLGPDPRRALGPAAIPAA